MPPFLFISYFIPWSRCKGTGFIRGTDSSALHVLRIIQEEAMKENTSALHVQLPVDVATYLLNEKRGEIYDIEVRQRINIVLIPNIHIETPNYTITRIRHDDIKSNETVASYKLVEKNTEENSQISLCLLYTSDAADERSSVDLGGRRIIKKKKKQEKRRKKKKEKKKKREATHHSQAKARSQPQTNMYRYSRQQPRRESKKSIKKETTHE